MTTPRDDIAGLLDDIKNRRLHHAYPYQLEDLVTAAATQLDALQARMKELEREKDHYLSNWKEARIYLNVETRNAEDAESRALRAEQERDDWRQRYWEAVKKHIECCGTNATHALRAEQERDEWRTQAKYMTDVGRAAAEEISRLQQERDEAYERLKPFAKVATTHPVTLQQMGIPKEDREAARDLVSRLAAGPEKEKK